MVIYDFHPPFAAEIANSLNIPAVYFTTTAAASSCRGLHFYKSPGEKFPFPDIFVNSSNNAPPPSEDTIRLLNNFIACFKRSCDIVLVKSFRELEGKFLDLLSDLAEKTMIPVGPLVQDPTGHDEDEKTDNIISWLDKKDKSSVVFLCFGSEYFLSDEQLEEVANGLEISKVNFIWAVRFLEGDTKGCLPEGFLERVGEKGLVIEGWAPQARILRHPSTGGFVSHCGWSSIMESMKFGVPIVALARHLDQPSNAKLLVDVGVGMEVVTDESGKFKREEIAEVIRKVVVEESGEVVRRKARELSETIKENAERGIDRAVEELVQVCRKKKERFSSMLEG